MRRAFAEIGFLAQFQTSRKKPESFLSSSGRLRFRPARALHDGQLASCALSLPRASFLPSLR